MFFQTTHSTTSFLRKLILCFLLLFQAEAVFSQVKKDTLNVSDSSKTSIKKTYNLKKYFSRKSVPVKSRNVFPQNKKDTLNTSDSSKISVKKKYNLKKYFSRKNLTLEQGIIFSQAKKDTSSASDSTKISHGKKYNPKKFIPHATISFEYDYGLIPFTTLNKVPDQLFRTEGTMDATIIKLPFNVAFSYTNSKNILGLNNYFRASFDAEKYKEQLKEKVAAKKDGYKNKLNTLYSSRQKVEQKLAYLKHVQKFPQSQLPQLPHLPKDSLNVPDSLLHTPGYHFPTDSLKNKIPSFPTIPDSSKYLDSLKNKIPSLPKTSNVNQYSDSLKKLADTQKYQDSIGQKINEYEKEIKEINNQIDDTKKQIDRLENPSLVLEQEYLYKNKIYRFFKDIKKLDVGLCYPNHSTFLVNGIALKGVNFEWQNSHYYFAFTHGKTINNIYYSNNVIQNNLNAVRNLYNFFDFNNVEAGRRITAVKFGIGQKDNSHLFAGVLYGLGYDSYYKESSFNYSPSIQKNYVFELDGKLVINTNNSLDIVYGKSLLRNNDENIGNENGFNALFNSTNRTHAALARYTTNISKTGTRLTFTTRYIDPYFKSFGIGFIRPNNFRYEIKADQRITKNVKISTFYRYEEDNLLSLLTNTTSLKSAGANITWRVSKRLTLRGGYTPVFLRVKSGDAIVQKNDNHIGNFIVTYTPKAKKFNSVFTGMYNYYLLYDGIQNNEFQNTSIIYSLETEKGIKNDLSGNWFYSTAIDSLPGQTFLATDELSVGIKKIRITAGGKYAYSAKYSAQFGYLLKATLPLSKWVSIEAGAEKIVLGEFYFNLNQQLLNTFPYFLHAKLIVHW